MIVKSLIRSNSYFDSLVLMRLSVKLLEQPGLTDATVMMGTEQNKHTLANPALLTPEVQSARPNDLFISVIADTEANAQAALNVGLQLLTSSQSQVTGLQESVVQTMDAAIRQLPDSKLVVLSIPGLYVKREARRALEKGLNLLIFSDNVPIEDELELKKLAQEKNLLVMGPDCGTAFIGGAALGFANQVRRGSIGIVAAAGTGLQEVATLIDRLGQGISHGIGTGSHDVSEAIGAITMIQGLRMLANDNATKVIGIVSKPPSQTVMKKVMAEVKRIAKPVVVNFLDGDPSSVLDAEKFFAPTLESAAILCVSLAQGESMDVVRTNLLKGVNLDTIAKKARHGMGPSQKYVRGLFAGGTFCSEACVLLRDTFQDIYTNINVQGTMKLPDPRQSLAHTCVDMGDDIFTIGKPHPMLEQSVRINRFKKEAQDPQTAVIFLDIVLGHGVHPDPGGEFAETIREGIDLSAKAGRKLCVIANVCGTENDPQIRSVQVSKLEAAGVIVMPSNAQGIRLAMKVVEGKQ